MSTTSKKRLVFLLPYPFDIAPGQRFRFEQYYEILKREGYIIYVCAYLSSSAFSILYKRGYILRKIIGIIAGCLRRFIHLTKVIPADYVFIYREAAPLGYPLFEWFISKILRKKIIYDFDDAIWLPAASAENRLVQHFKYPQKVALICRWAHKVSAGNKYLQRYALQFNPRAILNPTTIDTAHYHNKMKEQDTDPVVIGWTGTHSTLVYLDLIYPVLKKLEKTHDFLFCVIADREVQFDLKRFAFVKWSKETEIKDLLRFNIGVMPLTDDPWSQGKCGFKALQYMALGIPPVVSPVGVNCEIVANGIEGFYAASEAEWYDKLSLLLRDAALRKELGKAAMAKVRQGYSVQSNTSNFLSLFTE